MRLIMIFWLVFIPNLSHSFQFPYEDFEVKRIYKIDDGRTIVVESRPRGNTIWQVNKQSSKLERIADIWNFIDLAKKISIISITPHSSMVCSYRLSLFSILTIS